MLRVLTPLAFVKGVPENRGPRFCYLLWAFEVRRTRSAWADEPFLKLIGGASAELVAVGCEVRALVLVSHGGVKGLDDVCKMDLTGTSRHRALDLDIYCVC